jgi:hypothetical protein
VCFERGFLREFVPWPAVNAAEDWLGYVQCGVCIIGSLLCDILLSGDWVLMGRKKITGIWPFLLEKSEFRT